MLKKMKNLIYAPPSVKGLSHAAPGRVGLKLKRLGSGSVPTRTDAIKHSDSLKYFRCFTSKSFTNSAILLTL